MTANDTASGLLTDEARSWVGMEIEYPEFEITARDIARYASGMGNPVPAYVDPPDDLTAQPLLYTALIRPIVESGTLTEDGLTQDRRAPVGEKRVMFGGIDIEIVRPLVAGDKIHGKRRLESLEEKQGRRENFVLATWKTTYWDADDTVVMRETSLQILK
ncbi:MaoC family dehydratase [Ornithinimicrobium cavernae]|uniref:MaoC family dehydratase n=1 Tax=Ornithinimicrobium cavernae TaxID=2666047 RepID=UPI001379D294|nr:MaoC family dehydratase N-terminal domain-containing protein [Ornithinimicrobium cavernae]